MTIADIQHKKKRKIFFKWIDGTMWIDASKLKVWFQEGVENTSKDIAKEKAVQRLDDFFIPIMSESIMVKALITIIDISLASKYDRLWREEK